MEIARLFQIEPWKLLRVPLSEFRRMSMYYKQVRDEMENPDGRKDKPGPDDTVLE